jgi:hypothetical protein
MDCRLFPGSSVECRYTSQIARAAADTLGLDEIRQFLSGDRPNPGRDHWYYVLNFLQILHRARLRRIL